MNAVKETMRTCTVKKGVKTVADIIHILLVAYKYAAKRSIYVIFGVTL
jgi:hypothetical protein